MAGLVVAGEGPVKVSKMSPAPPGTKILKRDSWQLFANLPTFSIRDGSPADASSLLLKATIPTVYHWVPIEGMDPEEGVKGLDGFVRSHYAHIMVNKPATMSEPQARKAAIMLGTARAVSTTYYRIGEDDLIPGEKAPSNLVAHLGTDNKMSFSVKPGIEAALVEHLEKGIELTEAERAAVCAIVTFGAGIVPMQGYSLIMNQHHYLSAGDSQSRKVFAVVEKAFWKSPTVASFFSTEESTVQDLLWHKACHPVMINIKEYCAMNPDVKEMLVAAGAGACASRLPAEESELRMASSYVTLMATVNPMFKICGGKVDCGELVYLSQLVKMLPVGVVNAELPDDMPERLAGVVTNRSTGVRYLGEMLRRNQDSVAYCYGWYCAMAESSMTMGGGGNTATDTLRTSYSLGKLRTQSYASYIGGYQAYGDYAAVRNKQRAEGIFKAPSFSVV